MRLEPEAIGILLLIGAVLAPMWYVALSSGGTNQRIVLDANEEEIAPTETFIPSPREVNENVAGVITWIALFALVGMILYTHRFIHRMGRQPEPAATDGGGIRRRLPPYVETETRWLVDVWPASEATRGLVSLGLLSWATVVFAALLVWEGLTLARTQFVGVYAGMMFLSLAVTVAVYSTYFMTSVTVAERRAHGEKFTPTETEDD